MNGEAIKAKKSFILIALFSMLFTLFQPFVSEMIVYARTNEGNGSVSVLKVDEDSDEGLEGVELSIETEHGNKVDNKTTDEKGMATFDGLPSGKYNIKELNTADGYLLDENIYEVVVEKDKTTDLKISSEKENVEEEIVAEEIVEEEIVAEETKDEIVEEEIVEDEIVEDEEIVEEEIVEEEEIIEDEIVEETTKDLPKVTLANELNADEITDKITITQYFEENDGGYISREEAELDLYDGNMNNTKIDTMTHRLLVEFSGNESVFRNHKIRISSIGDEDIIRQENVDDIPSVENSTGTRRTVIGESYVREIDLTEMGGGSAIQMPIRTWIKFYYRGNSRNNIGTIPDGHKLRFIAEVIDENGEVVATSNEVSYKMNHGSLWAYGGHQKRVGALLNKDGSLYADYRDTTYFEFGPRINSDSSERDFERIVMKFLLPEGAIFDPDLEIDGVLVNQNWVLEDGYLIYDKSVDDNRTASGFYDYKELNRVHLSFPNAELGERIPVGVMEYIAYPKGRISDDEIQYFQSPVQSIEFETLIIDNLGKFKKTISDSRQINDWFADKTTERRWRNEFETKFVDMIDGATLDYVLDEHQKENGDTRLDDRMTFTHLPISKSWVDAHEELNVYSYVDGEEIKIEPEYTSWSRTYKYTFPENNEGFKVVGRNYTGNGLYFQPVSIIKDPENTNFEIDGNNRMYNESKFEYKVNLPDGNHIERAITDSAYYELVESVQEISFSKSVAGLNGAVPSRLQVDDVVRFRLHLYRLDLYLGVSASLSNYLDPDRLIKGLVVVDLMPKGMVVENVSVNKEEESVKNIETVDNYKGTGRQAVIVTYNDIIEARDIMTGVSSEGSIRIDARATRYLPEGRSVNEMYFYAEEGYEPEEIQIRTGVFRKDIYDVNDNGDTEEELFYGSANVDFIPTKEVFLKKEIANKGKGFSINGIKTSLGEEFEYKLSVVNLFTDDNRSVKDITVYDTLPDIGDRAIVVNEDGERIERNSEFRNELIGEIKVPEGYTAYYTTDDILIDEVEAVKNMNWETSLSDYSNATAFKVVMDEGYVLDAGSQAEFVVPMKAPSEGVTNGQRAYNSSALSINKGITFLEANKVYNEIHIPSGHIEINKVDSETKEPLANVGFELFDGEEMIAEGETDSDGKLLFENLKVDKEYIVKEVKPLSGYAQNDTEYPITVKENETHVIEIENEKIRFTNIDIEKIWKGTPLEEISIDLLANGEVIKTVVLNDGNEWKHTFKELDITNAETGEEIEYTVKEEHLDDYRVSIKGDKDKGFTITNREVGRPILPDTGGLGAMAIIAVVGGLVFIGWRKNKKEE